MSHPDIHSYPTAYRLSKKILPCLQGFSDPPKLKHWVDWLCEHFDGPHVTETPMLGSTQEPGPATVPLAAFPKLSIFNKAYVIVSGSWACLACQGHCPVMVLGFLSQGLCWNGCSLCKFNWFVLLSNQILGWQKCYPVTRLSVFLVGRGTETGYGFCGFNTF